MKIIDIQHPQEMEKENSLEKIQETLYFDQASGPFLSS